MRLPLRAALVIAVLAGPAHAQSSATPAHQASPPAGAAAEQPQSEWREAFDRGRAMAQQDVSEIWDFLGERNWTPLLLTLFNGWVAIFAYRLWKSTSGLIGLAEAQSRDLKAMIIVAREAADAAKRSAEAASLQARALVGTELPRLELGDVQLLCADQSVRQALKAPSFELRFNNYGRTPALVIEKCVEVRLGPGLPPDPAYDVVEVLPVAEAVESGNSVAAAAERRLGELAESQVQALLEGRDTIWVYGFVRFRDFLGMEHKTGFCLRWTPPPRDASIGGSFVPENPGAYIYQTDDWSPASRASESVQPAEEIRLAAE
jgi:hypothetical protein